MPGIGEKTALSLVKKFGSIDNLYNKLEAGESELKGKQKENLEKNLKTIKSLPYYQEHLEQLI